MEIINVCKKTPEQRPLHLCAKATHSTTAICGEGPDFGRNRTDTKNESYAGRNSYIVMRNYPHGFSNWKITGHETGNSHLFSRKITSLLW